MWSMQCTSQNSDFWSFPFPVEQIWRKLQRDGHCPFHLFFSPLLSTFRWYWDDCFEFFDQIKKLLVLFVSVSSGWRTKTTGHFLLLLWYWSDDDFPSFSLSLLFHLIFCFNQICLFSMNESVSEEFLPPFSCLFFCWSLCLLVKTIPFGYPWHVSSNCIVGPSGISPPPPIPHLLPDIISITNNKVLFNPPWKRPRIVAAEDNSLVEEKEQATSMERIFLNKNTPQNNELDQRKIFINTLNLDAVSRSNEQIKVLIKSVHHFVFCSLRLCRLVISLHRHSVPRPSPSFMASFYLGQQSDPNSFSSSRRVSRRERSSINDDAKNQCWQISPTGKWNHLWETILIGMIIDHRRFFVLFSLCKCSIQSLNSSQISSEVDQWTHVFTVEDDDHSPLWEIFDQCLDAQKTIRWSSLKMFNLLVEHKRLRKPSDRFIDACSGFKEEQHSPDTLTIRTDCQKRSNREKIQQSPSSCPQPTSTANPLHFKSFVPVQSPLTFLSETPSSIDNTDRTQHSKHSFPATVRHVGRLERCSSWCWKAEGDALVQAKMRLVWIAGRWNSRCFVSWSRQSCWRKSSRTWPCTRSTCQPSNVDESWVKRWEDLDDRWNFTDREHLCNGSDHSLNDQSEKKMLIRGISTWWMWHQLHSSFLDRPIDIDDLRVSSIFSCSRPMTRSSVINYNDFLIEEHWSSSIPSTGEMVSRLISISMHSCSGHR